METTRRGNGDAGDMRRDDGMRRASPMWPSNRDMVATPFEMMRRFTDQMDRMFTSMMPGGSTGERGGMTVWTPRTEMFERGDKMVVRVELPGTDKQDVRVSTTGDSLVIEGDRRQSEEQQRRGFYRSEWTYGHFHREIPLPESVDPKDVHAKFNNGVLEIVMPQPQQQQTNIRHDVQIDG